MRKDALANGQIYHIFTKSIAGFIIFNNKTEFARMKETIRYYIQRKPPIKLSKFIENNKKDFNLTHPLSCHQEKLIEIIAYCFMPTHLHLILKQLMINGIKTFMSNTLNSYTRYFNIKHNRKGPLWESRFKNVLIETDEQLLHLTRYIHLNPVTSYLVEKPEEWLSYSSYKEYISDVNNSDKLCSYNEVLDIKPYLYKKFVEDRISYQRDLDKIKHLLIEPIEISHPTS